MASYLQTVEEVYAAAARSPDESLCCTSPTWNLPDLIIPQNMLIMNYGCGSTVDPRELKPGCKVLYVGVGGGLEALQFAYFARRPGGVIAVDPVADMREKARQNLEEAARLNPWFQPDFVTLLDGNALHLPIPANSVSVAAQNCLFNVFQHDHLAQALGEIVRVLAPGGFFATSDPITPTPLAEGFRADEIARARCLSGCMTLEDYLQALVDAGFGRVEVRAKCPYRYLTPEEYSALKEPVLLESIEAVAYKVPDGPEGPQIFLGRSAIYGGPEANLDIGQGQMLPRGLPVPISEVAAARLRKMPQVIVTEPSYHARPGGCC